MNFCLKIVIINLVSGLFFSPLFSQTIYERDVDKAWSNCDFNKYLPGSGPNHHIMMIGDSNGALLGVSYGKSKPFLTIRNGDWVSKKWEDFMRPLPRNAPGWRVLNAANSGLTAAEYEKRLNHCLQSGTTKKDKFNETTPKRVWIQLGGNDIQYDLLAIPEKMLPHYAHYRVNKVLNHLGRINTMLVKNGRTVLHVSYFPLNGSNVADRTKHFPETDMVEAVCGLDNQEAKILNVAGDIVCSVGSGLQTVITETITPFASGINRARQWINDRLGISWHQINNIPGIRETNRFFRGIDLQLGRRLGLGRSLTGLFEDPADWHRKKNKDPMSDYFNRFKGGVPWLDFWNWLQTTPRGKEGWAVVYAQPNKMKAKSAVISIMGQRFQELVAVQGRPIPGTPRKTVEYLDLYPHIKHPHIEWGGRPEYFYDGIHLNDRGIEIYGNLLANRMIALDYDLVDSDYDFARKNWIDWVELAEDPGAEDRDLLAKCFFFGICKL